VRAGSTAPIVADGPRSDGVVVVQAKLAQEHPAPWWVLPSRLGILAGSVVMLPAKGVVLGVLLLTIWVVSGFLVRYPVTLAPGRALFKGGLANTGVPGTYWLRRRWLEAPHSIPLTPLHLDWRPAPTRLEQGGRLAWLELELELWVEPCADDVGQFRALLGYQLWQQHPRMAAKRLRAAVLGAVVEHVAGAGLMAELGGAPRRLDGDDVRLAIAMGLQGLGLELREVATQRIALALRTEDLETEDRLWIDQRSQR
jgi:hypothetical protein